MTPSQRDVDAVAMSKLPSKLLKIYLDTISEFTAGNNYLRQNWVLF